jgi:hypothetical protein
MLDRTVDVRARLDQARADLQTVNNELIALEGEKADASGSRDAFEQWRSDHATATAEKERLLLRIELLEKELARTSALDDEDERRKRYAAKEIENAKLAQRIQTDLAKANAILANLLHDVAKSVAEDQAINANLPDGLASLVSADFLARARAALPRQEITRERVWLWVRADNRALIGDQDAVEDLGEGRGIIKPPHVPPIRCMRFLFEEVRHHPAQAGERALPLWQMRLLQPDGPGVAFDGSDLRQPREVLMALRAMQAATEPRERPVETEIVPLGERAARAKAEANR